MIIDVHTHCLQPEHVSAASRRADVRAGYTPMQPLPFERYAEAMGAVDKAIVFGVRALAGGNAESERFHRRLGGEGPRTSSSGSCASIRPRTVISTRSTAARQISACAASRSIQRWRTSIQPIRCTSRSTRRPSEWACRSFRTWARSRIRGRFSSTAIPLLIDEVAQAFPDLKFVIAHMAHPWQRDCAVVIRKHANVYADVSGGGWVRPYQAWEALVLMVEWGVTDKLLFGSDFPLWTPQEGMDDMRGLNEPGGGHQPAADPRRGHRRNHPPQLPGAAGARVSGRPADHPSHGPLTPTWRPRAGSRTIGSWPVQQALARGRSNGHQTGA